MNGISMQPRTNRKELPINSFYYWRIHIFLPRKVGNYDHESVHSYLSENFNDYTTCPAFLCRVIFFYDRLYNKDILRVFHVLNKSRHNFARTRGRYFFFGRATTLKNSRYKPSAPASEVIMRLDCTRVISRNQRKRLFPRFDSLAAHI